MQNRKIWIGMIVISVLYLSTWHSYEDNYRTNFKADPLIRHTINFGLLMLVAITGWLVWKKHPHRWTLPLWSFIYTVVIALCIAFGLADLMVSLSNESLRSMISGLRIFFTSPVPYGIMIFFSKRSDKLSFARDGIKK
jgi:hypothetical protein